MPGPQSQHAAEALATTALRRPSQGRFVIDVSTQPPMQRLAIT
jgi:hypothetical protein